MIHSYESLTPISNLFGLTQVCLESYYVCLRVSIWKFYYCGWSIYCTRVLGVESYFLIQPFLNVLRFWDLFHCIQRTISSWVHFLFHRKRFLYAYDMIILPVGQPRYNYGNTPSVINVYVKCPKLPLKLSRVYQWSDWVCLGGLGSI